MMDAAVKAKVEKTLGNSLLNFFTPSPALTWDGSFIHSPQQMQLDWSLTSLRLLLGFPSEQPLFVASEFAPLIKTTKCTPVQKRTIVFGMQAEMT